MNILFNKYFNLNSKLSGILLLKIGALNAYDHIIEKLLRFSRKYYTKVLIRGILLFLSLGVIFFLLIMAVEYFLWLNSTGRLLLLITFLAIEAYLMIQFILVPMSFLLRIRKGISDKDASLIIGKHFPKVDDKLYNLLDLAEDRQKSELLLASIEQRSQALQPIPFNNAIDYRDSIKYIKYLIIPIVILLTIWVSGNLNSFLSSYNRVINYKVAYEAPAPFVFRMMSGNLRVLETEEITINIATEGAIQPEDVYIVINERPYLMQRAGSIFSYTFSPPLNNADFYFEANTVRSGRYKLEALKVPVIQDFKLVLNYPAYTGKQKEIIKSTGNANIPEGTTVEWEINSRNTARIELVLDDTINVFDRDKDVFSLSKTVMSDINYQLTTSNSDTENYERLQYRFKVIRDDAPTIKVMELVDSIQPNIRYYEGETADDYTLVSLKLVCYPTDNKDKKQVILLDEPNTNFKQFYYTFPSGLILEDGHSYDFYFEATDNDGIVGGKTSKSQVFTTRILDEDELNNRQLGNQKDLIGDLNKALDNYKKQEKSLEEINRDQKEKNSLSFSDQNQIKDFLKKQQQQEIMMKRFSSKLKENLNQNERDKELNNLLKERLERQEMEAQKNEKLLEELNKIADKLEKEELSKRLDELGKNQKNNERNLEQLLELTKRYYVTEKATQLAKDLENLAEKQKELSEISKDSTNAGAQEQLNKKFDELAKELDTLKKDNKNLKKPLSLKIDKNKEEGIKKDQKDALEELKNQEGEKSAEGEEQENNKEDNKASKKQRSASQKIKQMSEDLMESSSQAGSGSSITEDAEMLRQILDNLITFSFKQEALFEELESKDLDIAYFSGVVKEQKELRGLFEHIDDSLFSLSLRRAELSEFVNEQINEVYYNMDKSVESIVEGRIYQGVSYQQYVLTAGNNLADFLANILDNMQQSMKAGSSSGGQGGDFQLPDIIKSQQQLGEKMGQMAGKGKGGKKGSPQEGEGNEGTEPKEGEIGQRQDPKRNGKQGKGEKKSGEGNGTENESQGFGSEENLEEIYEIYKEQQRLRELLEKQLEDMIRTRDKQLVQRLIRQMEDFENDLLKSGVTERTMNKMNTIQHRLLQLENAALTQGEIEERKSRSNEDEFLNPITTRPGVLDDNRSDVEILNRQALPLHQIFKEKVKEYFDTND